MSTVYVLEPPTKGKVIVNTTHGPIDVELWPKEAPKSVRNFVQLCLEGYFDNTIFHRVIPGFLVQGGDPTGSGTGGDSIYGGVFADEFHSRLRFSHRGIVAMANASSPNSNGSQFFFTLDKCDWLDKKHTIFGKVTGDSIYNLLRLGEVDTSKDDRPLDPAPKILSVEVLWNPFEDIVPRVLAKTSEESAAEIKEPPTKPVKKLNLLSFGEEAEEEEKELAVVKQKIKSSHDVLNDPRLLKAEASDKERNASESKEVLSVREALNAKKEAAQKDKSFSVSDTVGNSDDDDDGEDETKFDAKMRNQVLSRRKEIGDTPSKPTQKKKSSSLKGREESTQRSDAVSSEDEKPRMEKLSLKKKGIGSEAKAEHMEKGDTDLQLYNASERARQLHKLKKRRLQGNEDSVLAKLEKFKQSISAKPFTSSNEPVVLTSSSEPVDNKEEDLSDWKNVKLKFAPERGKDKMSRRDDPDAYMVVDPLLEKGKEKFNRMQAKQKRREREWSGKSLA
ncbi:Peptidyl-prolyl cis-trans isomerase CYP57 [Arabidopsis thaliana]|uniref:Peptidyl-prolyl cis-trans isomerase CYP57 n=4 Tax=Arabidopsis TaxID=3701 RepID=CPY57_ARATH|nr:Cyclophilin-like peptidyl-prolyl cis-trans isomerase family protein [Arabidopsis thaliana]Q6Q152.1 RecName: Full=Peptidyl-prolyl cis-trans isomerase CYP57; Short=PPIase CYP57; AltName: Full=Cyclophilin of 57 kDa; AltName: Full=Cyclophilin-57 [Arabidopsis thaliana]KAG7618228.1 Cyclophilin-type peptidyl-prolyl cis-trans isomerase domain [Arabidopsis thaliana x Arabidopsis arenosa]KAG7622691.1 Cyclophilin-type peptidyl-prolyl cis-trans isomerase domain [Arabidopsis suecica]AAS75308.1 multidomai|eukprot:NP_195032.2 Cyclophilin-like peptidyl-prolyl cis-trans isomerase family protein [Arabidopsis thaliana]